MSRSIGDWDASEVGVIPDPLIDVLDTREIKRKILTSLNETCNDKTKAVEIDPTSGESSSTDHCFVYTENDVKIFAISATDVRSSAMQVLYFVPDYLLTVLYPFRNRVYWITYLSKPS